MLQPPSRSLSRMDENCGGAGCEKIIISAGHHRTIRNRNDPRF